jgi:transglutaminase-like putative cysteine protease
LGVITGLALGYSKFSPRTAKFLAVAYGLFFVLWQVGSTLGYDLLWTERFGSMGARLAITFNELSKQKPVTDNLFFHLILAGLFWSLSVYAGFNLIRYGHLWRTILPIGLAILIFQAYDPFFPKRIWYLVVFILLLLIYIARMRFVQLRTQWKINGTYLPPFIEFDSLRLIVVTALLLVLFAWTAPVLASSVTAAEQAWREATQPWTKVRNRLSNVFSSLQTTVGVVTDFYGNTLALGRGTPLNDTIIMTIDAPTHEEEGVRYYWNARTYDFYEGSWTSTLDAVKSITPDNFSLAIPAYETEVERSFNFRTVFAIETLETVGQPIWVSRPSEAHFAINPDGTVDIDHFKAKPFLRAGETYEVKSLLTNITEKDLQEAGTDYPEWITARYLQLPETITPRTKELAKAIAGDQDNPFDISQAITDYLRKNLTYNERVPNVPRGQEPIDWILFDHHEAFCNYYATAEVVMLRSLGIPSRLAVGYSEGEKRTNQTSASTLGNPDSSRDIYVVRHKDAHAWPEVFFPGIGWIEFEPTVSQQAIERPSGIEELANTGGSENQLFLPERSLQDPAELEELLARAARNSSELQSPQKPFPMWAWAILSGLGLAIICLGIVQVRKLRNSPPLPIQLEAGMKKIGIEPPAILRRWARAARFPPISRAYQELNQALIRIGKSPNKAETPKERAYKLVEYLPQISSPVEIVLEEYQSMLYGDIQGNDPTAIKAGQEIRKVSYIQFLRDSINRLVKPLTKKRVQKDQYHTGNR